MKFTLTARDTKILSDLGSFGFLSSHQIHRRIFTSTDKRSMLRRLRTLVDQKILARFLSSKGSEVIWALHSAYAKKMGMEFTIKTINRYCLNHDLAVNDLRIDLEESGIGSNWKSGHYLRFKASQGTALSERLEDTIPDWLVTLNLKGVATVCAIELELNFKGKAKMESIFDLYAKKSKLGVLWYVVPTVDLKNKIQHAARFYLKWIGVSKFKVSLVSEIKQDIIAYSSA